eukprot:COSAG04_NODE_11474_length_707_cov_1.039474_1_plen_94_part_10
MASPHCPASPLRFSGSIRIMECSGAADDGLFQQVLGLDELALILQAVGRAERGVAGLCAAERVCRGWRDALRSAEGLAAWRWAAAGSELHRLWA